MRSDFSLNNCSSTVMGVGNEDCTSIGPRGYRNRQYPLLERTAGPVSVDSLQ